MINGSIRYITRYVVYYIMRIQITWNIWLLHPIYTRHISNPKCGRWQVALKMIQLPCQQFSFAFNHLYLNSCEMSIFVYRQSYSLRWRHNGRDGVSNHQPPDCLLNRLFRRRSKKTSKPRLTGLCVGNSPGTSEFPAQMASNAENVSIWWRRHVSLDCYLVCIPRSKGNRVINWHQLIHQVVVNLKLVCAWFILQLLVFQILCRSVQMFM